MPAPDDFGIARIHSVKPLGVAALLVFLVMTAVYFAFRIPLWNPAAPFLSGLLLAAELFGTFTVLLHVFSTWRLVERQAPPPLPGFEADIFITTWNESVEILRHTLLAARQVSHARAVWLLDDGCRPEMQALAAELGVRYLTRTDRSHAKAGNLNNALQHSDAPFVAIFDCDHAPSPDFLERTLGYFIDPRVSFVQTPQDFYNVDSFQHRGSDETGEAWHEQTLFYRVIQPGKDYWDATFFCGSCAVMRRAAIDDIGGFATGTITEDMHTSLRLHKNGWSAVYHTEALAFGLSPATLEQYETQRLRWGRGAMQVWTKEGFLFSGRLTLAQRVAYLTSAVTYFEGWQKAVVYFLPMVVLLTGRMPIIWVGWPFVTLFLMWLLSGMIVNEIFSRGYAKTIWMEEYNLLRFFTFIKATLTLVVPIKWGFSVTAKSLAGNRGEALRLWPQVLIALGAIGSIAVGSLLYRDSHHLPPGAFLANLVWASITGVVAIKALRFATRRMGQRRSDHRFPIPLVARIRTGQGPKSESSLVIAQDVSSQGLRLALDADMASGAPIAGTLLLPGGEMPFRGTILRTLPAPGGDGYMAALRFDWAKPGDADMLNSVLYGNALQWDINGWAEVRRFSFSRVLSLFGRRVDGGHRRWRFGRLSHGMDEIQGLVRREGDLFRILSSTALPSTAYLDLRVAGGTAPTDNLKVVGYREYHIGGGSLHMAVLAASGTYKTVFHREPTWIDTAQRAA
ncbi:glycosyltransferase [Novosphingobium endophyticum]|uniref:glycosyltransferase n=1 Tax=Novosphingobium endophyticum TaxID=1955250 RepID=UPI00166ABCD0|nr:glycosyltransferase [Novosphingobium endophyticum]